MLKLSGQVSKLQFCIVASHSSLYSKPFIRVPVAKNENTGPTQTGSSYERNIKAPLVAVFHRVCVCLFLSALFYLPVSSSLISTVETCQGLTVTAGI